VGLQVGGAIEVEQLAAELRQSLANQQLPAAGNLTAACRWQPNSGLPLAKQQLPVTVKPKGACHCQTNSCLSLQTNSCLSMANQQLQAAA
jgi:hypothetical protein